MADPSFGREVDCVECGRHIVQVIAWPDEPHLCATCIHMPGWFREPAVRAVVDPTHDGKEHALGAR